jgi:hypothetical protein
VSKVANNTVADNAKITARLALDFTSPAWYHPAHICPILRVKKTIWKGVF